MPQLRDNSVTDDDRLGRLRQFDVRSRSFPIREVVKKSPRSYTWRCDAFLDQGYEGSCVGHGIAHELAARPSPVMGMDTAYAREKIYWEAQKIDPWDGGSYPGAKPFYEGTSVLAGVKVARDLGWFDEYRWGFSLDDLILGVGHNGPAVIGVDWLTDMFSTDADGFVHASGQVAGGHCLLVRGVSLSGQYFTMRNSWSRNWGQDGDAKISFSDMGKLLDQRGESVFFVRRHSIPKIPT